tara:strand:+ start:1402 stop:3588 length:2187 start_codon:yes stop_codon:yes gene_type:complete
MSLIIVSNTRNENDIGGVDDSIHKPYSFRNDMSSTITIPKNSQIALQSAKVNIDSSIILEDGNKFFYVYFGQGIRPPSTTFNTLDGIMESSSYPIKVLLNSQNNGKIAANPLEFASKIEDALNLYITHPQLTNRLIVTQKFNGVGQFDGYDFTFGAGITAQNAGAPNYLPTSYIPPDATATACHRVAERYTALGLVAPTRAQAQFPPVWTYAAGVFEVTQLRARTQFTTFNVPPIVNKLGQVDYDVSNAFGNDSTETARFMVGLSRSSVRKPGGQTINPDYYEWSASTNAISWIKAYADIACWVDRQTLAGAGAGFRVDGQLNLSQAVVHSLLPAGRFTTSHKMNPKWTNFQYWTLTAAQTDFPAAVNIYADLGPQHRVPNGDATRLNKIIFRVNGENISVHLESVGRVEYLLYQNSPLTAAIDQLKPLSQDCWNLYPIMGINNSGLIGGELTKSIEITNYTGANSNYATLMTNGKSGARNGSIGWVNGVNPFTGADEFNIVNGGGWLFPDAPGGYYGWEQRCCADNQSWRVLDLMSRPFIDRGSLVYTDLAAPRLGLNPVKYNGTSGVAPNVIYNNAAPVLITSHSDIYTPTDGAGMGELLGFSGLPIVNGIANNVVDFIISSTSIPLYVSTKSMFVRIENLTQTSTNMRAGQISKIVGHLPRFVQDRVNSAGPLYLEPTNLIYLDLNNAQELKINSLDVSLCYVDEKQADSLIGTSILVFHLREKP